MPLMRPNQNLARRVNKECVMICNLVQNIWPKKMKIQTRLGKTENLDF